MFEKILNLKRDSGRRIERGRNESPPVAVDPRQGIRGVNPPPPPISNRPPPPPAPPRPKK